MLKHREYLFSLANSKNKMRLNLIRGANRPQIGAICECIYNLLNGNINITVEQKEKLKPYRKILRTLVQKSTIKSKKEILEKHGTFLNHLLQLVLNNEICNQNDGGPIHT
jgi:ribosomal protein L23